VLALESAAGVLDEVRANPRSAAPAQSWTRSSVHGYLVPDCAAAAIPFARTSSSTPAALSSASTPWDFDRPHG